jgi:hypothetical protein
VESNRVEIRVRASPGGAPSTRGRLTPSPSAAEGGISSLSTIFQHQHHLYRKNGSLPRFEIGHSRMFMRLIHIDAVFAG